VGPFIKQYKSYFGMVDVSMKISPMAVWGFRPIFVGKLTTQAKL